MTYGEFTNKIKSRVSLLPRERLLGLAIQICRELFPDYETFYRVNSWGNPEPLSTGINLCEKALYGKKDIPSIQQCISGIDKVTPDMDDYGNRDGSYALNACTAITGTLEFITDQDTSHILEIISYYTDTTDFKIQEEAERHNMSGLSENEIDNHPLMIRAREFLLAGTK